MKVKTKEFQPSKQDLTNFFWHYLSGKWWIIFIFVFCALYINKNNLPRLILYVLFYALIFFLILKYSMKTFVENASHNRKRCSEIDDDFIITEFDDGSTSKIRLDAISKASRIGEVYWLYVNKLPTLCLPIQAFNSPEDIDAFKRRLTALGVRIS